MEFLNNLTQTDIFYAVSAFLGTILFCIFLKLHLNKLYPLLTALFTALSGTASLVVFSCILSIFEIKLGINIYTIFFTMCTGFPGAVLLMVASIFM